MWVGYSFSIRQTDRQTDVIYDEFFTLSLRHGHKVTNLNIESRSPMWFNVNFRFSSFIQLVEKKKHFPHATFFTDNSKYNTEWKFNSKAMTCYNYPVLQKKCNPCPLTFSLEQKATVRKSFKKDNVNVLVRFPQSCSLIQRKIDETSLSLKPSVH